MVTNAVYFSDGYGVKKIEIADMVGESQSQAAVLFNTSTSPALLSNSVGYIHGKLIDGSEYLAISYDAYSDGYGVDIITDESSTEHYSDGYSIAQAQLTDDGKLYHINQTLNQIEVFYGAYMRTGLRAPDYVYNISSTPALFPGEILCLHVESGNSARLSGGTRFFVGTSLGMTRVDTYDQESVDGYSAGFDSSGVATTYGIAGSGAQFESIGGTIPRVSGVSSNELSIIFVVTNDGLGDGGLTQIAISGNRKVVFLSQDNGLLPSNDIRDVFGKTF